MDRYEFSSPPLPPAYVPGAHVQGYDCLHDGRHPYVDRTQHNLTVKRLKAERDAERAELDRLTARLCSLLLHDGERFGRVAVPNVVRVLTGQPLPWEVS